MTFEEWADRTFGETFKEEETLTYFRMNAAWEVAAADEIDRLRYALKIAAKTFQEYAEIHAAKTPPDENKVRRNENLRDLCNEALTHNAICTPSGVQHDA